MPSAAPVLSALAQATNLAREATDGIPIVAQVIGAAARVVALAERIDKTRGDMRALAERAKRTDAAIAGIIEGRELDDDVLRLLEGVHTVLRAIEHRLAEHVKKRRLGRIVAYILTIHKDVERLTGELDDRLKKLEVATSLDTNVIMRDNARFIGQFRNVRHAEVHLLRRLAPVPTNETGGEMAHHLATCEGSTHIFVVRWVAAPSGHDDAARRRRETHDRILEQMSFVQNRHPTIAYVYGRNHGPKQHRFILLRTGNIRPLRALLASGAPDVSTCGRIVASLVDASYHLNKHGAARCRQRNAKLEDEIYIDENDEPKFGVCDDLRAMNTPSEHALQATYAAAHILRLSHRESRSARTHLRSGTWHTELFGELVDAGYCTLSTQNAVRRADVPTLIPFSPQSVMYLRQAEDQEWPSLAPGWASLLLRLAQGKGNCVGSILHAQYIQSRRKQHTNIRVFCIDDDGDTVCHAETQFKIPRDAARDVEERLQIPTSSRRAIREKMLTCRTLAPDNPGAEPEETRFFYMRRTERLFTPPTDYSCWVPGIWSESALW